MVLDDRRRWVAWLWVFGVSLAGCTTDWANRFASLGGGTAGERGEVQVLFINNTPYRAVFTLGTYDQTDPSHEPDFGQFTNDADDLTLEGGESSPVGALDCARVFSIGGRRLLALIEENLPDAELRPEATIEGVEFFQVAESGEAGDPMSQGKAPPLEALLGVDFPCGALLIVRLEINDAGPDPFRVDFELIASREGR